MTLVLNCVFVLINGHLVHPSQNPACGVCSTEEVYVWTVIKKLAKAGYDDVNTSEWEKV